MIFLQIFYDFWVLPFARGLGEAPSPETGLPINKKAARASGVYQ